MWPRLTEDRGATVCLIEAGDAACDLFVRAPALVAAMVSGRPPIHNWAFQTIPQPGQNGRRGFQARGHGLGGSSAIIAMLYLRGQTGDYDQGAYSRADGWDRASVLPYFLRAKGNMRPASALYGRSGSLQVADQMYPRPISRAFVQAAVAVRIFPNGDVNGPMNEGAGLYQDAVPFRGAQRQAALGGGGLSSPGHGAGEPDSDDADPRGKDPFRGVACQWVTGVPRQGPTTLAEATKGYSFLEQFWHAADFDAVRHWTARSPARTRALR